MKKLSLLALTLSLLGCNKNPILKGHIHVYSGVVPYEIIYSAPTKITSTEDNGIIKKCYTSSFDTTIEWQTNRRDDLGSGFTVTVHKNGISDSVYTSIECGSKKSVVYFTGPYDVMNSLLLNELETKHGRKVKLKQ